MTTVKDVAKELSVSERTIQRWINALRQHLDGAIRQEGRRVVLSDDAVSLLRQIRQLRDSGLTFKQAAAKALGTAEIATSLDSYATAEKGERYPRQQSRQCDVADVVIAVSCAVGALSLIAIAVALWLK